jgi:16S rRNA processing protein RimM
VLLGQVTGAHGIRGEVVIKSYAAAPEDIGAYGALGDEAGSRQFELKVVRVTAKGVIARIKGIETRTAAEALKGMKLFVARDQLPEPAAGEYYHADLIGLAVVDPEGGVLGEAVAVLNFGAGDLLEVRRAGADETALVPMTSDFVREVDIAAGRIVVVMPEGEAD